MADEIDELVDWQLENTKPEKRWWEGIDYCPHQCGRTWHGFRSGRCPGSWVEKESK